MTQSNKVFIVLFLFWLLFSSPFFLQGLVPLPSRYLVTFFPPWNAEYGMPTKNNAMPDILTQIFPWRYHSVQSLKSGEWGLWNPYSFSGSAHAGNYQASPYNPLNILFLLFPFIDAWSLLILFQPLLAGIFMYIFLRSLDRTPEAALLGSAAFMFCGFLTVWMEYGTLGYSVLYLPLILYGIRQTATKDFFYWWSGVFISAGVACSFLSGHFQMSVYVFLIALGYAFWTLKTKKRILLGTLLFFGFGIVIALPQLVVSFESYVESNRTESFVSNAGIPWNYLITLFAPDFYGNPVTRNDWFGQYAEWASYIGVIPLLLALVGMLRRRNQQTSYFFWVFFISVLLAFVSPISRLFYELKIPFFSTSVATRMIVFCSFVFCYYSAFGFDEMKEIWREKNKKFIFLFSLSLIFVCILVFALLHGNKSFSASQVALAQRNSILSGLLVGSFVFGMLFGLKFPKWRVLIMFTFLVFSLFDIYRFSNKWIPFEEKQYVFPETPTITYLKTVVGNTRVFGNIGNEVNTFFKLPSVEGYDALYQARYAEFVSAAGDGSIQPLERSIVKIDRQGAFTQKWLNLLGVRYILYKKSDAHNIWVFPHWKYPTYSVVFSDQHYEVLENKEAFPRAFLVSSYTIETEKEKILEFLTSENSLLNKEIVIEEKPIQDPIQSEGEVKIIEYANETIKLEVNTSAPKLLFLSDVYSKNWSAYINGDKSPIYRANYAFRSVSVPAGYSQVQFRYEPQNFKFALFLSTGTFFVLLFGSVRQLFYGNRNIQPLS